MTRFSSLPHAPSETRRTLRDRLARYLPPQRDSNLLRADCRVTLTDEAMLRLLLGLTVEHQSDLQVVRATYEAARQEKPREPTLDDAIGAGWLRVVWGRIWTPYEILRAARAAPTGLSVLSKVLQHRHDTTYLLADALRGDPELTDILTAIDRNDVRLRGIACPTPEWVAARLWDSALPGQSDPSSALRIWVDRWTLLGSPSLVPGQVWDKAAASAFRKAALDVPTSSCGFVGPIELRERIARELAQASQRPTSDFDSHVSVLPDTMVERALWFDDHRLQHVTMWMFDACEDVFGIVRLLLADVEAEANSLAPHKTASALFARAIDFPELFLLVLTEARLNPVLLADLLLYPATSALTCLLIAQWPSTVGAWDRETRDRDDQTTKAMAFADAVSVMGYFLEQGSLDPREAAALLKWFHDRTKPALIRQLPGGEAMHAALRDEVSRQSPQILNAIAQTLMATMPATGLGTGAFAAALDVIDSGNLADTVEPTPIVSAYIQSLRAGEYDLSASRVSTNAAATLVAVAMRAAPDLRKDFFSPLDIKKRLAAAREADENPYTVNEAIARSIRAHIRILSRAIAAWIEPVPTVLVDALVSIVRDGALTHQDRGRLGAFSVPFHAELLPTQPDRPVAADLGVALSALSAPDARQLLNAVLETDEPLILAQLLGFAPHAHRERIAERIKTLTPARSAEIHSLSEMQARIDALLSAGLPDVAEQFIAAERDFATWGKPPGREATRLRTDFRLKLLRRDWPGIAATQLPQALTAEEQVQANETLLFYKALAAMENPDADRQISEQMFLQLHTARPDVPAYAINLFSARTTRLLGRDMFGQLRDANLSRGRQVLREADGLIQHVGSMRPSELEIYNLNKALLLLATDQPDRASEIIASCTDVRLADHATAYRAVALARTGRVAEATASLSHAMKIPGSSDVLQAAYAHIKSGKSYRAAANVTWDDNPVPRIKEALFELTQLDPFRQAEVLHSQSFDAYVVGHVRSAAASVMALVPMMKHIKIDSCEDDLSALMRELLISRFLIIGWSVPDQSKGGFSAKGNPGERDFVLQKDTTALAVIEAVVHGAAGSKPELKRHFQKLLGYSTCQLFFHLTYAYVTEVSAVLDQLRSIAEHEAPDGFEWCGNEELPAAGAQPRGFVSRYRHDSVDLKVVFLILDLAQQAQRQAAATAGFRLGR